MVGLNDVSTFDVKNINHIIADRDGHDYSWFTAHTLRYLNRVLPKADLNHLRLLLQTFPDEARLIYKSWGWPEYEINNIFSEVGV